MVSVRGEGIWVAGSTTSPDLRPAGGDPPRTRHAGGWDAFVA
eukprot:CAMPEP_0177616210 /NCGR_PEP_ID=MMETSP0419_2-20121207/23993_1 /TAXON_ID=582737 /ORGANISM="Tetraselmis sp., Strain GSL018" /LENGTH=41 /DNA_ID= /DNA_START= /DNA_END= /DNA_ORIENTATION=